MTHGNPRLLLMHGAALGSWIWERVTPHLTAEVDALDLPGRGDGVNPGDVTLEQCIDFVARKVRASDAPSVLVGHSISAEVALAVASREPARVVSVVLVGGVVPESGQTFLSTVPLPQRLFLRLLLRRARTGIALPRSAAKKGYCNDLDDATTDLVLSRLVREAPRLYLDRVDWSPLPPNLPRVYVKLLDDKSVSVKQQDRFIERLGVTRVQSLHSGHLPMLARPRELAAILDRVQV
jgi:pimeloyl-ACP methyl ester carboxylesterase